MPVLIGGQSIGKSTVAAMLLPPEERQDWFADNLSFSDSEMRRVESLMGTVIVEASEMTGATRAEIERIKSFLSRQNDNCRLAYGRRKTPLPRRCVFIGTSNSTECIPNDPSGTRRFVVIPVAAAHSIQELRNTIDDSRDQYWAEALHRVDEGEKAWLTSDLEALAAPVNEQFRHRNTVVEDALEKWLASRQPSPFILAEAIAGINEMLDPGGQDSNTPAPDRIQYTTAPQVTVKTALQHLGFSPPTKTSKYKGASKRWWCFPDHWPVRDGG